MRANFLLGKGKEILGEAQGWETPLIPIMNYIIWNTRRANSAKFKRHFKKMIDMHKPVILALLETRMSDHDSLTEDLGFSKKIQYPAVRRSGGLVVMWNKDNININDINISP